MSESRETTSSSSAWTRAAGPRSRGWCATRRAKRRSRSRCGRFVAAVPAPLCIGTVRLEDGRAVHGFLCERAGPAGAREITALGGWRAYLRLREG
jgi:hypothetical protein